MVLPIDQLILSPAGKQLDASAEKLPLQCRHNMAHRGRSAAVRMTAAGLHTLKPASAVIALSPTVLARRSHSPFH